MSRQHANIWSNPGHYTVDPYTSPWSPKGHSHGHEWETAIHFHLALKIQGQSNDQGQN